jgi:hypothetical protein
MRWQKGRSQAAEKMPYRVEVHYRYDEELSQPGPGCKTRRSDLTSALESLLLLVHLFSSGSINTAGRQSKEKWSYIARM